MLDYTKIATVVDRGAQVAIWGRDVVRALIWPTKRNADSSLLIRLGRALHWNGSVFGLGVLAYAAYKFEAIDPEYRYIFRDEWLLVFAGGALALILARSARYVLSSE